MQVVCCQLDIAWEDRLANHEKVRAMLASEAPAARSLIVLPEMFASGFSMNVPALREGEAKETESFLGGLARQYHSAVVGGLVTAASDGRGRNEAVAMGPGGLPLERYCKLHPFSFAGEERHYATGQRVACFPWEGFTVAPFICYDLRFPEAFRQAVRRGADLMLVIANWPRERHEHWRTLLRARAIENQAYVVGVNRSGRDPHSDYAGGSMVVDPQGAILAQAGEEECLLRAELDPSAAKDSRAQFPALQDMREDLG